MSSADKGGCGKFLLILVLAPVLIFGFIIVFGSVTPPKKRAVCGTDAAATSVDLTSLPKGPIAGYSGPQLVTAAQIMLAADGLGMTVRDQQIAIMTAMGESDLGRDASSMRPNGDHDVGVFQQRALPGWYADGQTEADNATKLLDTTYAARTFYLGHKVGVGVPAGAGPVGYHIPGLADISGRASMEPTLAAHAVQGNADPYHYAKWWPAAQEMVRALSGVKPAAGVSGSAVPTQGGGSHPGYETSGMKPYTASLANALGVKFGLKTIGGWRPFDPANNDDPVYGHTAGLAIDFMVDDIPNGATVGTNLAAYLQQHAGEIGVQYIIYRQHIWAPYRADEGWRAMPDRGSPTANHMDHVHLSLSGKGGSVPAGGAADGPASLDLTGECPADSTAAGPGIPATTTGWAKPANGPMTSPFGMRTNPVTGVYKLHSGMDIGAACNTPVYAARAGVVTQAGAASGYGNLITIDHGGGLVTRYGHEYNDGVLARVGDKVAAGQQIGKVGSFGNSTGCHLHFEVMVNGQFIDPEPYLAKAGVHFT